ncbi:MAG: insulinase family protein, partial [Kofleriaceae bacterium]|nr:insulinase family protein [Kofleriaceae bacterium]
MTRLALLGIAALVACGPKSPPHRDEGMPWASAGIDWDTPPAVKPTPLATPSIDQATLANGMRVFVVANPRLPIVTATAYVTRAGGRDDGATPGVAALTAQVLDELAHQGELNDVDVIESSGMSLDTTVATDFASFQITGGDAALAIDALGRLLQKPVLADAIIARVRDRHVGELAERRRRDRTIAAQVFDRVLFGDHPYGHPAEGTDTDALKLTASDVIRFWHDAYGPDATTIVLAGNVSKRDIATLEATFAGWTKHTVARPQVAKLPAYKRTLAVVDRPGAEQAVVLVGGLGPATAAPDRLAADVANAVLGGGIGSRLDRRLHDELAVTLGAGSSFWRGEWAGTWAVATTFRTERAAEGLRATLDVIESARTTPM